MNANSLTVPATLESLPAIAAFVTRAAEAAGLDHRSTYRLRLAAGEFASNAVLHGCAGRETPGTIEVRAEMGEQAITVVLEDTGVPFDPRQVPPPDDLHLPLKERRLGGLGIYLALQSVDRFSYERVGERNRNVLVVRRPPPAGA
jgi:serine/threonine-protein kinase RsbW